LVVGCHLDDSKTCILEISGGGNQESKLKDQNETENPNLSLNGFSNFDF
jgi:hypothetical protein